MSNNNGEEKKVDEVRKNVSILYRKHPTSSSEVKKTVEKLASDYYDQKNLWDKLEERFPNLKKTQETYTEEEKELYLSINPSKVTTHTVIPELFEKWVAKQPGSRQIPPHEKIALLVLDTIKLNGRAKEKAKRYLMNRGDELADLVVQYPTYGNTYEQHKHGKDLPPYFPEYTLVPPNAFKVAPGRTPEQILFQIEVDRYFAVRGKRKLNLREKKSDEPRKHYDEYISKLSPEERATAKSFEQMMQERDAKVSQYLQRPKHLPPKELLKIIQAPTKEGLAKLAKHYPLKQMQVLDWQVGNAKKSTFNPETLIERGRERVFKKTTGQTVFRKSAILFIAGSLYFSWLHIRQREENRQYLKRQWRLSEVENPKSRENFIRSKFLSKMDQE